MVTATVSVSTMTILLEKMPAYSEYLSSTEAATAERTFRRALGSMLKDCGIHLMSVLERRSNVLNGEQKQTIEVLVDRIAAIFRRLDREGSVCLVGDCAATISELEDLDSRLIMMVEEALVLTRNLETDVPAAIWFKTDAGRLCDDLDNFSEMAEERNYLLGLGWESEFVWPTRSER